MDFTTIPNIYTLLAITFFINTTAMHCQKVNNIEEFKMKIGYDSVLTVVDEIKSIVFRNVDPENWSTIKTLNKKPVADDITIDEKGISKEWVFKLNEDMLTIELFIATTGHAVAMKRLLNDATATTMRVIPFEKCPYNLGDINVSIIDDNFYRILWTHCIAEGTETITFILADLDALVCSKHEVTITVSK